MGITTGGCWKRPWKDVPAEMNRVVLYGNSGSGKSTLAQRYRKGLGLQHLDLDTIAWAASGVRKETAESIRELHAFMDAHESWVIEGCYGSLVKEASRSATQLVFLNPGIMECQKNCRARPWESHKYKTQEEQDANLKMLLKWVADYEHRRDEYSLKIHREIFASYNGIKQELKSNREIQDHSVTGTPIRPL